MRGRFDLPTRPSSATDRSVGRWTRAGIVSVGTGGLTFLVLWVLVVIVEVVFAWDSSQSPLPPPTEPEVRVPMALVAGAVGVWAARNAMWSRSYPVVARIGLVAVGTVAVSFFVVGWTHEVQYLACVDDRVCDGRGPVVAKEEWVAADSETKMNAGDQACGWLTSQPWGEPPDTGSANSRVEDTLYAQYVHDLGLSATTPAERIQMQVAKPAWKFLCPFQRTVHRELGRAFPYGI